MVHIIIPVYNAGCYLKKCLDSLLEQTYRDFEVILVDDGSTDNSLLVCNEYHKKDERFSIIHKDNGGVSSARNVGLDYLFNQYENGYVTYVDADDWVERNYLETLVNMISIYNVDIVCSSFNTINGSINKPFIHTNKEGVFDALEATRILLRDESIQSHSVSKLFKLNLWKNIRYNTELFYMEDQEVIYKVFYKPNKIYITNYAGYYYRQDNVNSVTKTKINNKKVISGLKGYYYPCLYDGFRKEDRDYLLSSIHNALVNAYLMLIPYYKVRLATDDEKAFIKELKKYIKDNKLIKQFVPNGKDNMIKKKLYRVCPALYPLLFSVAKKISS